MSESSMYKYFRPMTVISSIIGQFSAERVWVDSSHQLHFKKFTLSLLVFVVERLAYSVPLVFITPFNIPIYVIWRTTFQFSYSTFVGTLLLVRSKAIIKAFKIIDFMRENLINVPPALKPGITNPTTFSIVTTILLLLFSGTGGFLPFYVANSPAIFYLIITGGTVFSFNLILIRIFLLSSLMYSCSLVIKDTVQAWQLYSRRFCRPCHYMKGFCRLVLTQTRCTAFVNKVVSGQVLVILVDLIFGIVLRVFSTNLTMEESQLFGLYKLVTITTCITLLAISAVLPGTQMNEMNHEVFAMAVRDISKRETFKVRLLLEQTHDSQVKLTASGFWHVRPDIILFFLSLQLEFFLLIEYYKSQVRDLYAPSASSVITASHNITMKPYNTTVVTHMTSSYYTLYTP